MKTKKTILVTGSAGFIGFHTSKKLLDEGFAVVGLDNFNDYYDPALKEARNAILEDYESYKLYRGDLADLALVKQIFKENKISKVCHFAAQAGVRYSLENPHVYIQSNLVGFTNLIEETKNAGVKTFVYASSSSVYGDNKKIPFSIDDDVNQPISLYAATKKANELIAYTYHHLYGLQCTGLRFFTVYGPWGRPDMAYFKFAEAITKGKPIDVYNQGKMKRDFTYIDDIVSGILASLEKSYPFEIFNLGNNKPVTLDYFIKLLESSLGREAIKNFLPRQPGDVLQTFADINYSKKKLGFEPKTSIEEGIDSFVDWYSRMSLKNYIKDSIATKEKLLSNEFLNQIDQAIKLLAECYENGNKVLIAGNGGSAADSQHFAGEIVGRFQRERRGYPAIALTVDSSVMTSWANDYDFNSVFARQIEALGEEGDVVIGISTSGNSENIIQGIEKAKQLGLKTFCLLGKDGGKLKSICDLSIIVPSEETPRIQEAHELIIHMICAEVEKIF